VTGGLGNVILSCTEEYNKSITGKCLG